MSTWILLRIHHLWDLADLYKCSELGGHKANGHAFECGQHVDITSQVDCSGWSSGWWALLM